MSSDYQPFESLPPRKVLLHHRLILLCGGTFSLIGWSFVGMGSLFATVFGTLAATQPEDGSRYFPVIVALVFLTVGIVFLCYALKRNFKTIDLLTNGQFARGKVIKQRNTPGNINGQPIIEYTVSFEAADGKQYELSSKTHLRDRIGDESEERVLYLSADPSWGEIFDSIPNRPAFFADGSIKPPHWGNLIYLFIPSLGLISFLTFVISVFANVRMLLSL